MLAPLLCLLPFLAGFAFAVPTDPRKRAPPTIQLDQGTFVGTSDDTTNKFLGIPFGKAPYVRPCEFLADANLHCPFQCWGPPVQPSRRRRLLQRHSNSDKLRPRVSPAGIRLPAARQPGPGRRRGRIYPEQPLQCRFTLCRRL